jgi:hypothetical protein
MTKEELDKSRSTPYGYSTEEGYWMCSVTYPKPKPELRAVDGGDIWTCEEQPVQVTPENVSSILRNKPIGRNLREELGKRGISYLAF